MASKHLWIAELQDRDGTAVEYHSIELEPAHYEDRTAWNRAMTSWSAFRQRERRNLKSVRPANSKVQWATHWMMPDDITFLVHGTPKNMVQHKTIWELYASIGYDYKTQTYRRRNLLPSEDDLKDEIFRFIGRVPWNDTDPDITKVLDFIVTQSMTYNTIGGFLRLEKTNDRYSVYFSGTDGVHGSEWFTDVRVAIFAYVERCDKDPKIPSGFGTMTVMYGDSK